MVFTSRKKAKAKKSRRPAENFSEPEVPNGNSDIPTEMEESKKAF